MFRAYLRERRLRFEYWYAVEGGWIPVDLFVAFAAGSAATGLLLWLDLSSVAAIWAAVGISVTSIWIAWSKKKDREKKR